MFARARQAVKINAALLFRLQFFNGMPALLDLLGNKCVVVCQVIPWTACAWPSSLQHLLIMELLLLPIDLSLAHREMNPSRTPVAWGSLGRHD